MRPLSISPLGIRCFGIGGGENFERVVNSRWGVHNLFLANLVATGVPGFGVRNQRGNCYLDRDTTVRTVPR